MRNQMGNKDRKIDRSSQYMYRRNRIMDRIEKIS